jgi:hypothetical protein
MRKTLVAATAGFLFQAGDLHAQHLAQAAASPIRRDAFVRVIARPHPHWQQGRVLSFDSTRLLVELAEKDRPILTVPLASLDSLERRYSVFSPPRAAAGAAIGTIAGGLSLGALGWAAGRDDTTGDGGNYGSMMAFPGAMLGAILGFVVGGTSEKRWAPVGIRPPSVPPPGGN